MKRNLLNLKTLIILAFYTIPLVLAAQSSPEPKLKFYGHDRLLIEGTTFMDSVKENIFDRFPASMKNKARGPVWSLSKSSSGISARFITNSTIIRVKWDLLNNLEMNHMASTGIKGLDLYCRTQNGWQYVNTARPTGKSNDFLLISNMKPEKREFMINLSLYDGVTSLKVGIDSLCYLELPQKTAGKPIIFYGTSITQGGCASRPGMLYTNIISRKLGIECINFGFSGQGKMEKPETELISKIDARFYVIDGVGNMQPEEIHSNAVPLLEIIRSRHPETPVIFVECTWFDKSWFDQKSYEEIKGKNDALKSEFNRMKSMGFKNIFYIESDGAIGNDHEATVDAVHFTDLGFLRYADFMIEKFNKFRQIRTLL
jgi:hypothetical protein